MLVSAFAFLELIFEAEKTTSRFGNLQIMNIKEYVLFLVRLTLALTVIASWSQLRNALQKQFGNTFAWWFSLVTVTQYHFMFYMSRPLPNIMVLPLGKSIVTFLYCL